MTTMLRICHLKLTRHGDIRVKQVKFAVCNYRLLCSQVVSGCASSIAVRLGIMRV